MTQLSSHAYLPPPGPSHLVEPPRSVWVLDLLDPLRLCLPDGHQLGQALTPRRSSGPLLLDPQGTNVEFVPPTLWI